VEIVVKMDADGQMDPAMLPRLLAPILGRQADYTKGNRFAVRYQTWRRARARMPRARLFGNSVLSFLHKAVSGYWHILDPTNGYTAIHRAALESINLDEVSHGYFFENDLLYQLSLIRAVVQDIPMPAVYGGEKSHLQVGRVLFEFPWMFARRLLARVFFQYFINDFNIASLELAAGLALFAGGVAFGAYRWFMATMGPANTAGTVMLSSLPIILGFQLLLSAISYDIANVPRTPLCRFLDEEAGCGQEALPDSGDRGCE